jgi:hypothetical protein
MLATIQLAKEQANLVLLQLDLKPSRTPITSVQKYASTDESSSQCTRYGYFDLYPAVYPNVVPYPAFYEVKPQAPLPVQTELYEPPTTRLTPCYPSFDICK